MKFEFDSNNATELRAVEAAVAVLLGKQTAAPTKSEWEAAIEVPALHPDNFKSPLVASVTEAQQKLEAETQELGDAFDKAVEQVGAETVVAAFTDEDLDSAGQPWNPELHSSSRAKVADGTWKKKRGARSVETLAKESGLTQEEVAERLAEPLPPATRSGDFTAEQLAAATPPVPPVPPAPAVPTPPAPQADGPVTMNDIWALITNGKTTINVVLEAAQRMGFADLGKVAQTATAEQRAALLKELTV